VEVVRHGTKTATIGMEQKELSADKDFALFYSAERSDVGMSLLTYRSPGADGYFMLFASPGFGGNRKVIPKDVVFVVDTSGSMSGKKLEQAKKALTFCIQNLNEEDRFEVIRFSTETEALFREMKEVSTDSRKEAEAFVTKLKTIGGTAIHDALKAALGTGEKDSKRPKLVVFLTDGLPTVGESSVDGILQMVKQRSQGLTRVFAFGVGTDVNTHLLDRIAEETRAVSQYVLPDENTEVKLSSFFSKINDPVLADVALDFGDVKTSKIHPGTLPDLFQGQQLIVLGRYSDDGKARVVLRGKVGDDEKSFSETMNFAKDGTKHEFIPRLWATRRVGFLLEEIRHRGQNAELKEEVTALAKQYGIVTPYTSYLVTEDQPVLAEQQLRRDGTTTSYRKLARTAAAPSAERERLVQAQALDQFGDAAVAGARLNYSLKSAENMQQVQQAPQEVRLYVNTGQLQSRVARPETESAFQNVQKFVGQRTFQNDGTFWNETSVIGAKEEPIRLEFDSKDYWDFVLKNPELKEVLALGVNVRFLHSGKIHEIYGKNI
jgi:Ca-activated chloride channel family protein